MSTSTRAFDVLPGNLLAVVESGGEGVSHLTQFSVDEGGSLTKTASSAIASSANGVAIVPVRSGERPERWLRPPPIADRSL